MPHGRNGGAPAEGALGDRAAGRAGVRRLRGRVAEAGNARGPAVLVVVLRRSAVRRARHARAHRLRRSRGPHGRRGLRRRDRGAACCTNRSSRSRPPTSRSEPKAGRSGSTAPACLATSAGVGCASAATAVTTARVGFERRGDPPSLERPRRQAVTDRVCVLFELRRARDPSRPRRPHRSRADLRERARPDPRVGGSRYAAGRARPAERPLERPSSGTKRVATASSRPKTPTITKNADAVPSSEKPSRNGIAMSSAASA